MGEDTLDELPADAAASPVRRYIHAPYEPFVLELAPTLALKARDAGQLVSRKCTEYRSPTIWGNSRGHRWLIETALNPIARSKRSRTFAQTVAAQPLKLGGIARR